MDRAPNVTRANRHILGYPMKIKGTRTMVDADGIVKIGLHRPVDEVSVGPFKAEIFLDIEPDSELRAVIERTDGYDFCRNKKRTVSLSFSELFLLIFLFAKAMTKMTKSKVRKQLRLMFKK